MVMQTGCLMFCSTSPARIVSHECFMGMTACLWRCILGNTAGQFIDPKPMKLKTSASAGIPNWLDSRTGVRINNNQTSARY
jgi:hypothetical protein